MELAQQLAINAAIVAGRVRRSRQNYRLFSPLVGSGQIRRHFFRNRTVSNPPSRSQPLTVIQRGAICVGAIELSGPGGRPIPIDSRPDLSNLSDEELGLEFASDLP